TPLRRSDVLPAVETALRLNGAAMVRAEGGFRLVPLTDAPRQGEPLQIGSGARNTQGYGVRIVPLRYVSVEDMQRALEPLVPQGSVVRVDPARNLLVLGGAESDLAAIADQIAVFDVDWLAGMSFALFPLKMADAKTLSGELREILGAQGSPLAGIVKLVPIE